MVDARTAQAGIYGLGAVIPETRVAQGGVYALISTGTSVRVAQAGFNALVAITAEVKIAQAGMYILAGGIPCTTRMAQIWTITRTDGEVFRLTSLDRDLIHGGEIYDACNSLNPSASESAAHAGSVGNMDLTGAVTANVISEHALSSGLFDNAEVEAWLVSWDAPMVPKMLLAGTFGAVQFSETGFTVEVIGDGAKLAQTPLVSVLKPDCRWRFGDPLTCGKDLGPLTVAGTVDAGDGQRGFTDAARVEAAGYFSRGRVTFTTGNNDGISAEIKAHATGGVFTLWPRLAFPTVAGDQYSMTPGCTNMKAASGGTNGCTAWANLPRFGGFDKVPGGDKRTAAANVKA